MIAEVTTPEAQQQGLMGVEQLPEGMDGMLFTFEEAQPVSFTMRNTLLPLDIWWFDGDGVLLGSTEMEPCPETPCPTYPSLGPVRWALETVQGEHEFAAGDRLSTG